MNNKTILFLTVLILTGGAVIYFGKKTQDAEVLQEIKKLPGKNKTAAPIRPTPTETLAAKKLEQPLDKKINEELQAELDQVMEKLPTNDQIRDLSAEEVHHTPQAIKQGGVLIGTLLSRAQQEPERRKDSLKFLLQCAENDELASSVRALCWNSLLNKVTEWKIFIPLADAKVPSQIKSLASKLL